MTAESKQEKPKKADLSVPETVRAALESVANVLGVAVKELWIIFVRQYVVRGLTEGFTGIVLCVASYFLYPAIGLFILIPLAFALVLFYGAIALLGNPRYYALEDIAGRVNDYREADDKWQKAKAYYGRNF